MSVIPLSSVGADIVRAVKQQVVSSVDILDADVIDTFTPEQAYEKFGSKFLHLVHHHISVLNARRACDQARIFLKNDRSIKYPLFACQVAVSTFGAGECGETAIKSYALACQGRIPCFLIRMENLVQTELSDDTSSSFHDFVILGPHSRSLFKLAGECEGDAVEALSRMKEGVIVDPFLGLSCKVNEFKNSILNQYLTKRGIRYIHSAVDCPESNDNLAQEIEIMVQKVSGVAKQLIASDQWKSDPKAEILTCFWISQQMKLMADRFPHLRWEKSFEQQCLWTEGRLDEVQKVCAHFNEMGFQIEPKLKDGEIYIARVTRADLSHFGRPVLGLGKPISEQKQDS